MKSVLVASLLVCLLAGCAAPDLSKTSFMSVYEDTAYIYCRYEAYANAEYPEASRDAEAARMKWLEAWLHQNGLGGKRYEIASRNTVRTSRNDFDIFYEVRVAK